jgi:hypothetical protein
MISIVGVLGHSSHESSSMSRVRRERHRSVLTGVMLLSLILVSWRVCLCLLRIVACGAGKSKIVKRTPMG